MPTTRKTTVCLSAFVVSFGLLANTNFSAPAVAQSAAELAPFVPAGIEIYNQNCAICHGPNGDGMGSLATQFTPRPRDFTKGSFKFRSTGIGEPPAARDLLRTIQLGVEGSYGRSMPSFASLSIEEQLSLVAVIQNFAGFDNLGIANETAPQPAISSAAKGQELYVDNGCVECHGETGDGNGVLATDLTDDNGLPLQPANLRAGKFKGGDSAGEIWMRLNLGLEGTPMPSFGQNLTIEEIWSLVLYVQSLSES